jgi:DNA mismatch repair ATPase MutL
MAKSKEQKKKEEDEEKQKKEDDEQQKQEDQNYYAIAGGATGSKEQKKKEDDEEKQKKEDDEQQKQEDQKYYAIAGGATGLTLGAGISYFLFKDSPMSSAYKLLFSALIMIGNTIIPGYIGYYGGEVPDTIVTNILYYLALFILIVILLFNLKAPGVFDSFVLVLIFSSVFVISLKFGVEENGILSVFWIPILFIFGIILSVYYYFGYFVKVINNIQEEWTKYDSDKVTDEQKTNNKTEATDTEETKEKMNILIFDIDSQYKTVFDKLFEKFNPKTVPNLVKDVEKVEKQINIFESMGRQYMLISIAALIIGLAVISAIVFYIVEAVSKDHIVVSDINLFTSKLKINVWMLGFMCIGLCIITFIVKKELIDKYFPQFKPENLEAIIDKSISVTDFMNNSISSANAVQTILQKGGGKIDKPDKKTNKNEKEMYLSFKI